MHRPALCVRRPRGLAALVGVAILLGTSGLSACGRDDEPESASETPPEQTQAETTDDGSVSAGEVAATAGKFLVIRRLMNKREAEVEQLEAEVETANAEADQAADDVAEAKAQAADAEEDAARAEQQASSASAVEEADAEAEQAKADAAAAEARAEEAEAESRVYAAKAEAAAACAKGMLEIIAEVPQASDLAGGLEQAAGDLEALAATCEDSVADAGG